MSLPTTSHLETTDYRDLVASFRDAQQRIRDQVRRVIVGQDDAAAMTVANQAMATVTAARPRACHRKLPSVFGWRKPPTNSRNCTPASSLVSSPHGISSQMSQDTAPSAKNDTGHTGRARRRARETSSRTPCRSPPIKSRARPGLSRSEHRRYARIVPALVNRSKSNREA